MQAQGDAFKSLGWPPMPRGMGWFGDPQAERRQQSASAAHGDRPTRANQQG